MKESHMTTMHPARKRLLLGFLLLAATFFYAFAPTCGLVGRLISRASAQLLGQTGSTLLSLTMFVVGLLLVVPHDSISRFFRWAFAGRAARVAKVVRESDEWIRAADVKRIVAEALSTHDGLRAHFGERPVVHAQIVAKPEAIIPTPAERMRLDDVRGALKGLGYKTYEYEKIVAGLDPTVPLELLVKDALRALQRN
jgi:RuvA, C-terminal domain/4TM region of DNA translocase FtsK/SpoIIIE